MEVGDHRVTHIGGGKKKPSFTCNLITRHPGVRLLNLMVVRHVNKKTAGKPRVLLICQTVCRSANLGCIQTTPT